MIRKSGVVLGVAALLAIVHTPVVAQSHGDSVWVNTNSGKYHCPGTHSYGTSKHGQYMTEAAAVSRHFAPAKGRSCASRHAAASHDTAGQGTSAHAGQVWVDARNHTYRCPGSSKYGTGNHGTYMTEQAALAAGNQPHNGKRCH